MGGIKVLVADDHPAFREGLCQLLDREGDMNVIGKAADGNETVMLVTTLNPDVAIINAQLPKLSGIAATIQIKAARPGTAVIVLCSFDYESYVLASIRAGASGFLLKTVPVDDLLGSIRVAHDGGTIFYLSPMNKILVRAATEGHHNNGTAALHDRELEVLKTAAKGMSNKQIAKELGISERTVQNHLSHIFRKMHVDSRFEAMSQGLQQGLLTPDDLANKQYHQ